MAIAQSRISPQGQISVPAEVRKKLGLEPGAVVEWDERDGEIVVRRGVVHTMDEVHRLLFPDGPPPGPPLTVEQMDEAIGDYLAEKHARR